LPKGRSICHQGACVPSAQSTRDLLNDRGMMGDSVIDLPRIRGWVEGAG
jgi:hypothetical protein